MNPYDRRVDDPDEAARAMVDDWTDDSRGTWLGLVIILGVLLVGVVIGVGIGRAG